MKGRNGRPSMEAPARSETPERPKWLLSGKESDQAKVNKSEEFCENQRKNPPKKKKKIDKKEHIASICAWVSEGKTLKAYCELPDTPAYITVYKWLENDRSFDDRYRSAKDIGFDNIAEGCIAIADEEPNFDEDGRMDPAHISWAKNRISTRMKLLSCWSRKKYGERRYDGDEGKQVQQVTIVRGDDASL